MFTSWIESGLMVVLAAWAMGSLLFLFRIPALHPLLHRINRGRWFIHWSLFSAEPTVRAGTFVLQFRDWHGNAPGEWRPGASGHAWSPQAGFWFPRRWLASAVQNLGRRARAAAADPDVSAAANESFVTLCQYVGRMHPPVAGARREYRLVRHFLSGAAKDELIISDDRGD